MENESGYRYAAEREVERLCPPGVELWRWVRSVREFSVLSRGWTYVSAAHVLRNVFDAYTK